MSIGEATQETVYSKSLLETLSDLEKALGMIGNVKAIDRTTFTIQGTRQIRSQTVKD